MGSERSSGLEGRREGSTVTYPQSYQYQLEAYRSRTMAISEQTHRYSADILRLLVEPSFL
jgi:hypothetical protein